MISLYLSLSLPFTPLSHLVRMYQLAGMGQDRYQALRVVTVRVNIIIVIVLFGLALHPGNGFCL